MNPNHPRNRRQPGRGVERFARKPMGGGHSRFPERIFDMPINDVGGSRWKSMEVPGGVDSQTESRTHDYQRETAAREMATRCFEREDSSDDSNRVAENYLRQTARL